MASSRCSVETYSSLKLAASLKARSRSSLAALESVACAAPPPETLGRRLDLAVSLAQHGLRTDADLLQHGQNDAFFVLQQRRQQVQRQQFGIAVLGGEVVASLHRFLRLDRKFFPTDRHRNSI